MTLREQVRALAVKHHGQHFADTVLFPRLVDYLAITAFIQRWDHESFDARVIHRAWDLLLLASSLGISAEEPGVDAMEGK